jgi:adenine-specific DNA-methyltransferase
VAGVLSVATFFSIERKEHGFSQRRADYAFYLAPNFRDVKFYVEAKKPHGDIATAGQLFPDHPLRLEQFHDAVAVLHDFEQFEILDCRYRPHIETALGQNLRKYHFSHYEDSEKFAEIYWLFSREAVANGSLEKFAATLPKKTRPGRPARPAQRRRPAIDEAHSCKNWTNSATNSPAAFKNPIPNSTATP